ncbi:chromatin remodeling complex subunit [Grosmannia clavigera kw1407]|uniref:Chromatin remodeling complex subunit n=1 Tax=Grosmannia clavigera (strain kw1407 / UAMH 11150) TaxID=655863 RepID=F0XIL4_GROCL|nr:chromatin remodeling complex subunit [Grosmannia clavigera kw1407]EFX02516.1 chromatin remodeling complex subunit [Grosmannia clavigera kw1407]
MPLSSGRVAGNSAFAMIYDDPLFGIMADDDDPTNNEQVAFYDEAEAEATDEAAAAGCDWMDEVDFGSPRSITDAPQLSDEAGHEWELALELQMQLEQLTDPPSQVQTEPQLEPQTELEQEVQPEMEPELEPELDQEPILQPHVPLAEDEASQHADALMEDMVLELHQETPEKPSPQLSVEPCELPQAETILDVPDRSPAVRSDDHQPSHGDTTVQMQVIISPLPASRRAEYKTLPASNYVATVVRRVRGKDRFEIEFDDGERRQVHIGSLFTLPNGQKSLQRFRQTEEGRVSLSAPNGGSSKRRKIHHYRDEFSEQDDEDDILPSDMDMDTGTDTDDHRDNSRLDDSNASDTGLRNELTGSKSTNRQDRGDDPRLRRRHLRSLTELVQSGTRHSSRLTSTATATATGTEDDEATIGTSGRQLRSRRSLPPQRSAKNDDDDMDELAGDGDFVVLSDIRPNQRPRRGWNKRPRGGGSRRYMREDSIEMEVRQRPSRAAKNMRSMVDSFNEDDDDMLYADDGDRSAAVTTPKIINVKEVFQPLTDDGAFADVHSPLCDSCGGGARAANKGLLLHCQGCSLSYHRNCIGYRSARDHMATKVGPDSFVLQCRFCVGVVAARDANSPNLSCCCVCRQSGVACAAFSHKKTAKQEEKLRQENDGIDPITPVDPGLLNRPENVLFRCSNCRLAFHFQHLPPPSADVVSDPSAIDRLHADRLAEYSIDWKCRECLDMPARIDALVAWRPMAGEKAAGQTMDQCPEDEREYLVKWHGMSYAHCVWKPGAWIWGAVHSAMRSAFAKRGGELGPPPVFDSKEAVPEEYLLADVILAVRYKQQRPRNEDIDNIDAAWIKVQGLGYDATEWDGPPPRDSGRRWDAFAAAYDEYLGGRNFHVESSTVIANRIREFRKRRRFEVARSQPAGLTNGSLMPYQMEGLNWLLLNFYKSKSVVLADEMGLGKTVQVVALLAAVVLGEPRCWPFLVVVPNATCGNWRREIKTWAPGLRVVTYHGGREAQRLAYEYELFPDKSRDMRAHVVIMSYDSAQDETTRSRFKGVSWAGLVVDEGQRLKNDQNLLYLALRAMRIGFRLLLTGTPLQNNKRELFNLLQFVDSNNDAAELDERYSDITAENLPELHKLIRPYFLRRTKAEVLKFLPPMAQIIVPVSMTVLQEKLCKSIMAKNPDLIRAIFSKTRLRVAERSSLNNILMQLRKCLCHPFIYNDAIEEKTVDQATMVQNLVEASSKLVLLRIMLPKLKARGRRVLLFSQFLHQLDIVEDFLTILGLPYGRLDGSMSSMEKQKRIDAFNAPDSPLFAFLLSTRAGGVGINLATADTVIVMDPDFNPHQDMQAFSRAHRIGQKNHVLCFQLVTKDSVEEKIMQVGRKKMALDHALIESMDAEDDAGNDLESILKHGAESLFSEHSELNRIVYDSAAVDQLLDRAAQMDDEKKTDQAEGTESQFSFARVWAYETGSLADADIEMGERAGHSEDDHANGNDAAMAGVWDNIIREREAEAARIAAANKEVLGRGGRRRTKVMYAAPRYDDGVDAEARGPQSDEDADGKDHDDGDAEFEAERDVASSSDEDDAADRGTGSDVGGLSGDGGVDSATGRKKRGKQPKGTAISTPRKKATPKKATPKSSPKKMKTRTPQKATPKRAVAERSSSARKAKMLGEVQKQKKQTPVKTTTPKTKGPAKVVTSRGRKTKATSSAPGESPQKKARVEDDGESMSMLSTRSSLRSSPAPSLTTLSMTSVQTLSSDTDTTISQQTVRPRQKKSAAAHPPANSLQRLVKRTHDAHVGVRSEKQRMSEAVTRVAAASREQASQQQGGRMMRKPACKVVTIKADNWDHEDVVSKMEESPGLPFALRPPRDPGPPQSPVVFDVTGSHHLGPRVGNGSAADIKLQNEVDVRLALDVLRPSQPHEALPLREALFERLRHFAHKKQ